MGRSLNLIKRSCDAASLLSVHRDKPLRPLGDAARRAPFRVQTPNARHEDSPDKKPALRNGLCLRFDVVRRRRQHRQRLISRRGNWFLVASRSDRCREGDPRGTGIIDPRGDGPCKGWNCKEIGPKMTVTDEMRDIQIMDFATARLSSSVAPGDAAGPQGTMSERAQQGIKLQRDVTLISEIEYPFRAAQGSVIAPAIIEPVMIECRRGQYGTDSF